MQLWVYHFCLLPFVFGQKRQSPCVNIPYLMNLRWLNGVHEWMRMANDKLISTICYLALNTMFGLGLSSARDVVTPELTSFCRTLCRRQDRNRFVSRASRYGQSAGRMSNKSASPHLSAAAYWCALIHHHVALSSIVHIFYSSPRYRVYKEGLVM